MFKTLLILSAFLSTSIICVAQRTVGLVQYEVPNTDGYILFAPLSSTNTYLIDKCGEKIHEWTSSYTPGTAVRLLEDGSLLRCGNVQNQNFMGGGNGGVIEKYNWDGILTWTYMISDSNQCQHHDIQLLPNGNILAIVWERYTDVDAIANGKNPQVTNPYIWSEKIVELEPTGFNSANIVWEWRLWDHLIQDHDSTKLNYGVVTDHPELVNINYVFGPPNNPDWIHLNSIDYNETLDQIIVSAHQFHEFWVIDHSTSTGEAATHSDGNSGKGGDLLYRWGNPASYDRGTPNDRKFFGQHHSTWIPDGYPDAGKILLFNNGIGRPSGQYSSIEIIDPPVDGYNYTIDATNPFAPEDQFWIYTASTPTDFYSPFLSGVYPLSNGSFIITSGVPGTFFEIDSDEQTTWKYINPVSAGAILSQGDSVSSNTVFRAEYYPTNYPAFTGQTLTQLGEIELDPLLPSICDSILFSVIDSEDNENEINIFPNPTSDILGIQVKRLGSYEIELVDLFGRIIIRTQSDSELDISSLPQGFYFIRITQFETVYNEKIMKL